MVPQRKKLKNHEISMYFYEKVLQSVLATIFIVLDCGLTFGGHFLILILGGASADASADESAANFPKIWFSHSFSHFFELFREFWVQLSPSLFYNTGQFSELLQVHS